MSWIITGSEKYETDPYRSQVSLLLHGDGPNGSTTFTDTSPTPKIASVGGTAKISTASSKFGGASMLFDGTNGCGLTYTGPFNDFIFPDDFTIELWFKANNAASNYQRFLCTKTGNWDAKTISLGYGYPTNRRISMTVGSGVFGVAGTTVLNSNQWYHYAVSRSGSTVRMFLDGQLEATGTEASSVGTGSLFVSGYFITTEFLDGYIDDLRITKGVARYTSNFTPPTAPFPDI
jgi:hypothetical protein